MSTGRRPRPRAWSCSMSMLAHAGVCPVARWCAAHDHGRGRRRPQRRSAIRSCASGRQRPSGNASGAGRAPGRSTICRYVRGTHPRAKCPRMLSAPWSCARACKKVHSICSCSAVADVDALASGGAGTHVWRPHARDHNTLCTLRRLARIRVPAGASAN